MTQHVQFFQRRFPSANMVLLHGPRPVLVDSGFGSDADATVALLTEAGVPPQSLALLVNTHYHCDHVGGNHALQSRYGTPIAAHAWDAGLINRRSPEACAARWLRQPVEVYHVQRPLRHGDLIDTGAAQWEVVHAPGHTLGHILLHAGGVVIAGDTLHADDVSWLNVFREGVGALERIQDALDTLASLKPRVIYSGHGPANTRPLERIEEAHARYEKWARHPERVGWHATKRIFTYALMLEGGLREAEIAPYLLASPWYLDYSRWVFGAAPVDFVQPFLAELMRSGATYWQDGLLLPTAPYTPLPPGWLESVVGVGAWG